MGETIRTKEKPVRGEVEGRGQSGRVGKLACIVGEGEFAVFGRGGRELISVIWCAKVVDLVKDGKCTSFPEILFDGCILTLQCEA